MTIDPVLMRAILSMDAYNRGYNRIKGVRVN